FVASNATAAAEKESTTTATSDGDIWFFQKGADSVMSSIVATNDWLDEETANMAREGLRTLVVGRRHLSAEQYQLFSTKYKEASLLLQDRDTRMSAVIKTHLENDLELLGVTGVEDKLQKDVKASLELLRDAGVKIWMLTGDKIETARCVAVSSKLVSRRQYIHTVAQMKDAAAARDALEYVRNKPASALLIDGQSLSLMLSRFRLDFISVAVQLPAVIACRCSPTQKAEIALLIRTFTKKRVCCIGDGGNDVSMIQAADVGIGIVGKEGRQASLAADYSITQFHHLTKLLFWHGRNSYKRSAKMAQFLMHRGVIISACQTSDAGSEYDVMTPGVGAHEGGGYTPKRQRYSESIVSEEDYGTEIEPLHEKYRQNRNYGVPASELELPSPGPGNESYSDLPVAMSGYPSRQPQYGTSGLSMPMSESEPHHI
ncbi:hypothetical protein KEM56_004660, partial [Ascosphaera pollenicola]